MKSVRKLLQDKSKPLVMPGVYDAIGAKIVEKVGFEAMFQTGYGTSATLFGMPDYGFIGSLLSENASRMTKEEIKKYEKFLKSELAKMEKISNEREQKIKID